MKNYIAAALIGLSLTGCVATPYLEEGAQTPLQLQAIQSRDYEAPKGLTFAATMSVLQDLGYIIQSADKDTGFITATSTTANTTNMLEAFGGVSARTVTKVTVFIEEFRPALTRVRLNFVNQRSGSSSYGQQFQADTPITDAATYNNALEKIEDAVFIRKG